MKTVSALRAIKQGILICDKNSRIYYFNKAYEDYIGVSLKVAQGRPLVEFRSGARAPEVIETGMPIEGISEGTWSGIFCQHLSDYGGR